MAPAHGDGVVSASLERMSFRVVTINIAYCSLGGLVLNLLLRMGEIKTSCFFFFMKYVFEQFMMTTKTKLKADRHMADVARGFSAQKLTGTSKR